MKGVGWPRRRMRRVERACVHRRSGRRFLPDRGGCRWDTGAHRGGLNSDPARRSCGHWPGLAWPGLDPDPVRRRSVTGIVPWTVAAIRPRRLKSRHRKRDVGLRRRVRNGRVPWDTRGVGPSATAYQRGVGRWARRRRCSPRRRTSCRCCGEFIRSAGARPTCTRPRIHRIASTETASVYSASRPVMQATFTMSSGVAPRERSLHGRASPCTMGPIASAPGVRRCVSL